MQQTSRVFFQDFCDNVGRHQAMDRTHGCSFMLHRARWLAPKEPFSLQYSVLSHPPPAGRLPARLGDLKALEKLDCWDNFLEGACTIVCCHFADVGRGGASSDSVELVAPCPLRQWVPRAPGLFPLYPLGTADEWVCVTPPSPRTRLRSPSMPSLDSE